MEDKLPWVLGAIVIIVLCIALSANLSTKSKDVGSDVLDAWGESAKSNLTFGE